MKNANSSVVFLKKICNLTTNANNKVLMKNQQKKTLSEKYSFMASYDFKEAYRTSNMIDRLMDFMDKFL